MKVKTNSKSTMLAARAMQRAAIGVLGKAVKEQEPIPIWDGEKVVLKIPEKEFEQCSVRGKPRR